MMRFAAMAVMFRCLVMTLRVRAACRTPGQNFPILEAAYDLQTISDDGNSLLPKVTVTNSYESQFFYSNCEGSDRQYYSNAPAGATIFRTPSGQATTAHSKYTRVELRARRDWYAGDSFTHTQSGTLYVLENSATDSLIFAQIHGEKPGGSELLKVRYIDAEIKIEVKQVYGDAPSLVSLISGVDVGEKIEYTLQAVGTSSQLKVTFTVSTGSSDSVSKTFAMPASGWCGIGLYFKAGNYNQDPNDDGSHSVLAYSALDVTYDGEGEGEGDGDDGTQSSLHGNGHGNGQGRSCN